MIDWDPDQYARFAEQRDRAAIDLLTYAMASAEVTDAWDLGCGDGNWTGLIAKRFPKAKVRGLDSSEAMLADAREGSDPRIDWIQGDIADFHPLTPPDLIFSNAALHWLPEHARLFPRLAQRLKPGGRLAVQMPVLERTGWRAALAEVAEQGPWAARLQGANTAATHAPEQYYDWLKPHCASVDVWTTTYLHELQGEDAIVDWTLGSTLRPYLARLDDDAERRGFLDALRARFSALHPCRSDGVTLFPFARLFILAER